MSGLFSLHPAFRDGSGGDSPPRNRVKRVLFGPTDHEENKKFVKRELEESNKAASQRWNFNFKEGTPCEGRFQWESASGNQQQEEGREPPAEHKENRLSDIEKDVLLGAEGGSSADLYTPLQGTSSPAEGGPSADPQTPLQDTSTSADVHTPVQGTSSTAAGGSSADLRTPLQGTSTSAAGGSDEAQAPTRTKDQKLVTDFLPSRKNRTKSGKIKVQEARLKKRDTSPVSSSSD